MSIYEPLSLSNQRVGGLSKNPKWDQPTARFHFEEQSRSAPEVLRTESVEALLLHSPSHQQQSNVLPPVHFHLMHTSRAPLTREVRFHNQLYHRHELIDNYDFRVAKRRRNSPHDTLLKMMPTNARTTDYVDVHVHSIEDPRGLIEAARRYIRFLREVNTEIEEHDIPKAVERYQRWMTLASHYPQQLLYLPLDILFIFSVHVTLPASYEKVCEKLFGKLKKPSDLGRRDEKLNIRTNRKWKKEYGENMHQSPYWDQSHIEWHPENAATHWQLNLDVDLIGTAKERLKFLHKLQREAEYTKITAKTFLKSAQRQYYEFLFERYGATDAVDENEEEAEDEERVSHTEAAADVRLRVPHPPNAMVELMWHTHMQNPKQYRRDIRSIAKMYEEQERERRLTERRSRGRETMEGKKLEKSNSSVTHTKSQGGHHLSSVLTPPQSATPHTVIQKTKESEEPNQNESKNLHDDDDALNPVERRKERSNYGAKQRSQLKKLGKILTLSSAVILVGSIVIFVLIGVTIGALSSDFIGLGVFFLISLLIVGAFGAFLWIAQRRPMEPADVPNAFELVTVVIDTPERDYQS